MSERGYFERLSQRALTARQNAAPPALNGAVGEETSSNDARDRLVAHRYRLEKRIGRGRLGDVFEAIDDSGRDVGANRRVAIQLIDDKIAANARIVDDVARAFALLRTSSHPNVVRILDFGMHVRASYVVMDLLEGISLRSILEEVAPEPLGVDETWPVILAVGDALQYLHAKGLTHGDLRPESVFITFEYGIKLLDLAPHFPSLAPFYVEDAVKESATSDPRDDVYGLACLTYELLSGRHPFNANTPFEAHRARLEPRPLSGVSPREWDAIARGLELERARRTPTVKEYLQDLDLTGNERLRAANVQARDSRAEWPPTSPSLEPTIPTAPQRGEREDAPRYERPRVRYRDRNEEQPSRDRSGLLRGALRATFSVAAIAAVGAFAMINYDGLRSVASDLMTALDDELAALRRAERAPGDELDPVAIAAETAAVSSSAERARAEAVPPAAPAVLDEADVAPLTDVPPSVETSAVGQEPAVPEPKPNDETQAISVAVPAASGSPVPSRPPFAFARPVVVVSERESAVAVVIDRSGDNTARATFVWWVSGDSATPDEDYVEIDQRVERIEPGEDSLTVFIPLIGDSTPEDTETFSVYVGRYDPVRRHIDATSSMRVNIVDDD